MSEETMNERNPMTECFHCIHKQNIPGNFHIRCANPDPKMSGDPHGIKRGWFVYPICFDPSWKTKICANFEEKK